MTVCYISCCGVNEERVRKRERWFLRFSWVKPISQSTSSISQKGWGSRTKNQVPLKRNTGNKFICFINCSWPVLWMKHCTKMYLQCFLYYYSATLKNNWIYCIDVVWFLNSRLLWAAHFSESNSWDLNRCSY